MGSATKEEEVVKMRRCQFPSTLIVAAVVVAILAFPRSGEVANSVPPRPVAQSDPASVALDCPAFDGDDVIWYDQSDLPSLSDAECNILTGEKLDDGTCRMSTVSPVRSAFDSRIRRLDELAFDPSTCRSLVRTGYRQTETTHPERKGDESEAAEFPSETNAVENGQESSPSQIIIAAHNVAWYDEPVTADVAKVRNKIRWFYPATGCPQRYTDGYAYTWYELSGWSKPSDNFIMGADCEWVWNSSYVHFHNGVFCFLFDTEAYADRNWIYGNANGSWYAEHQWHKSGPCSALLNFHQEDGPTY